MSDQSRAGIGAPRPTTRGLSATVAGLQNPASSKWAEAYNINRFGEEEDIGGGGSFKVYWLSRPSIITGGGLS